MLRPSTFSLVSSVLHWSSFLLASGASFSENSTICVVLVLASADHLSSFTVRFSWFLMRLTFGWILRLWVWCHEAVALKYSISNDPTVLGKGVPNLLLLVNGVSQFPAWPGWRGPCYCGGRGWGSLGLTPPWLTSKGAPFLPLLHRVTSRAVYEEGPCVQGTAIGVPGMGGRGHKAIWINLPALVMVDFLFFSFNFSVSFLSCFQYLSNCVCFSAGIYVPERRLLSFTDYKLLKFIWILLPFLSIFFYSCISPNVY